MRLTSLKRSNPILRRRGHQQGHRVRGVRTSGCFQLRPIRRCGGLLNAAADRDQLKWSSTIYEVVYGTQTSIRKSVQENDDLESIDYWERTPFLAIRN